MAPGPEDDPDPDNEPDRTSLSDMTKTQLLEYASENGIQGLTTKMTKAEMIEKIEG